MSSFDCISFIENESDFPIFNESLMNNKKSTKNSFCDDLLENLGITNKNINSENDLQEGNCVQNVNYFEDDMDVDNRLDEFNIPEVTEFNKNCIVNMHSLHEDQPSMNVDIQNKNILTYEIKDIKEDKIEDAVISSNTNSLSSMNCSTAPSTPVKKASNQNTRSKNLAKRKRNRSNNRKIHENKDSEVPTKRFKKSEQKCNEKLEEAIENDELKTKIMEETLCNSITSEKNKDYHLDSESTGVSEYIKKFEDFYSKLKENLEEEQEKSERMLEMIKNLLNKECFVKKDDNVKLRGRPEKVHDFRLESIRKAIEDNILENNDTKLKKDQRSDAKFATIARFI